MRQLGEQWVEEGSDGKMHMYKAVEGENCTGCVFGKMCQSSRLNNIHVCDREDDCPLEYSNTVVKDLGPVNEDGLLGCPFCGEYLTLETNGAGYYWLCCTNNDCLITTKGYETKQEAIDAGNRRN